MPAVSPLFVPGNDHTVAVTAAVVGGRFLNISATQAADGKQQAAHAPAAGAAIGVAATDQASGGDVLVYKTGVVPVEAGAAITAGQRVEAGANGTAVPLAAGIPLGVAGATVAGGAFCPIHLNLS
jgi:hypothetical protein